jgi:diaminopimelate decarboxylase
LFDAELPLPRPGDLLAVLSTGAYNHTMASNYNFFFRPPVVFVRGGQARLVVRRETPEDLLARDIFPG